MDEDEDFLAHYGVKGMKWGVTRKKSRTPGPAANSIQRRTETAKYGKRGHKRINKAVSKGKDRKSAVRKENVRVAARMAVAVSIVAVQLQPKLLKPVASIATSNTVRKTAAKAYDRANTVTTMAEEARRFKKASNIAATMMADSRGLTSYATIAGEVVR